MDFSKGTYLVLEFAAAKWVDEIKNFRKKYEPWRSKLPVEITVIGSSGVGAFSRDQNAGQAFQTIDKFAQARPPLAITFVGITAFPGSNLYFFEPENRSMLVELQKEITNTGLKFDGSPYSFNPHCTIANLGQTPFIDALAALKSLTVPLGQNLVHSLSFYQLDDKKKCELLHRSKFGQPVRK